MPNHHPGRIRANRLVFRAQKAEHALDRKQARELYEHALRSLDADDTAFAATILRWIGRTYLDEGMVNEAEDCFEVALHAAEASDDLELQAYTMNNQAIVAQTRGDLDTAARLYRWSWSRAREVGDIHLAAMVEQNQGIVSNIRGDFGDALHHYQRSLAGYRRAGRPDRVGPILINIGRVHTDLGRWGEAERTLREAARECNRAGDVEHRVLAQVNLTRLWIQKGDFVQARISCDTAQALARRAPGGRWAGLISKHHGIVLREAGRLKAAAEQLQRSRRIAADHEDILLEAEAARELAEVHNLADRGPQTLHYLNEAHRLFSEFRARRDLSDVRRSIESLEARFLEIVHEWGASIESKDHYTQGHCERVADFACDVAREMGMEAKSLMWFRMGALLHDVGKVAVPSEILNKPGSLTEREWEIMKRHVEVGVELLEDVQFPWDIRPMVRHHHERWDGRGYPDGLAGTNIPLSARILCVADVFDALTSDRSYRGRVSVKKALAIMEQDMGRAFDPEVFHLFKKRVVTFRLSWGAAGPARRAHAVAWPRHAAEVVMGSELDRDAPMEAWA